MNEHFMQPVRGKTRKGAKTRERIIETACDLIMTKGVAHTNLDEILAKSNTGKGQFYHYFESKDNLVRQVLKHQSGRFLKTFSILEKLKGRILLLAFLFLLGK